MILIVGNKYSDTTNGYRIQQFEKDMMIKRKGWLNSDPEYKYSCCLNQPYPNSYRNRSFPWYFDTHCIHECFNKCRIAPRLKSLEIFHVYMDFNTIKSSNFSGLISKDATCTTLWGLTVIWLYRRQILKLPLKTPTWCSAYWKCLYKASK